MGCPRISIWQVLITTCLLMALPFFAQAEPGNKVFRFNVSPNGYPPYLIPDNGNNSGIIWDVMKTITDRLGYRLEPFKVPRKRVDQMLHKGIIDGTPRAREWTIRPEDFVFTDPIVNIEEVIFFPVNSPHDFRVVEDLFSLTLVTHLGYQYPRLRPHFNSGRITRFDVARDQDLFVYVKEGSEMDAAVADRLAGQWMLLQMGLDDEFRASATALSEVGYRIMMRPEWASFANDFNRELAAMRDSGELEAILSKYR